MGRLNDESVAGANGKPGGPLAGLQDEQVPKVVACRRALFCPGYAFFHTAAAGWPA